MLNETNSELEERLDSAAIEEMAIRSEVQLPAPIYHDDFVDAYRVMYDDYMDHRQAVKQAIAEQQEIEAKEWNKHYYGY